MFIPFISEPRLFRRKGGGGGGRGGGGGGRSSGGGGKSSSGGGGKSSNSKGQSRTGGITTGSSTQRTSTYSRGFSSPAVIPTGQLFAGRIAGGGSRSQIFGTK